MDTSKNKLVVLLLLLFVFIAAIFAVLIGYRLSNGGSTVGNPNAAISCSYCDLAVDVASCKANCTGINNENAGVLCPNGTTKQYVVRNDQTAFTGCKPNGANITTAAGTGESCNNNPKIPTLVGFTKSYYGYCMYEPVSNCRWWNPKLGDVNNKAAWEDCGCVASSDAAVNNTANCNPQTSGNTIEFVCGKCGQQAAAMCPTAGALAVSKSFTGQISCTDNNTKKPVKGAVVTVTGSDGKTATGTSDDSGNYSITRATENPATTYTFAVTGVSSVSPAITSAALHALGFDSNPTQGCIPGANTSLTDSNANCNVTCNKDAAGTNYVSCIAKTGASLGYNFSLGKCDTPVTSSSSSVATTTIPVVPPSFTCYKCDTTKTPWVVVSNSQLTTCESPSSSTKSEIDAICKQKTLTCYSCSGGTTKTDVVNETAGVKLECPTGTNTTAPATCKVTCNICATVSGVNQNTTKDFLDVQSCPTGYYTTAQVCTNTCYYCDSTTDPLNWSIKSEASNNIACDNSKGRYSSSANLASCVAPKVDINIVKTAVKYILAPGEKAVFNIVVKNVSEADVTAKGPIKFTDKFDDGLVYESISGTDFVCGSVDTTNRTYSCTYSGDLKKGESKTLSVTYSVTKNNIDLNNKVFVSLPNHPQGNPCVDGDTTNTGKNETKCDNNNSTDKVMMQSVGVNVTKTAAPVCDATNDNVTVNYTITISNTGTGAASLTSITDTVDSKITSSMVSGLTDGGVISSGKITWTTPISLAAGASKKITYIVSAPMSTLKTGLGSGVNPKLVNTVSVGVANANPATATNTTEINCNKVVTSTSTTTTTTLPKTAEDVSNRWYIMIAFGMLILAIGVVGYRLNIATIAAKATGRNVGSRKFESSFDSDEK